VSAPEKAERIAKVIARAGVCSRREAERLIAERRVSLDGVVLETPATTVPPGATIIVDGKPLPAAEPARLWRYHKPPGVITTARDPQGRPTVFERLPETLPRVLTIGRLDLTSEGLLLLTNDGEVKRRLELPATGWTRRYRVRVHGRVDPAALKTLARGTHVEGIDYGPIDAVLERQTGSNAWVAVALKEGKNREVRHVLKHLGLTVNRLIRVAYGPFQLGQLPAGAVREVPAKVVREQLGGGTPPQTGSSMAKKAAAPRKPARKSIHENRRRPA
jgi:23S rRNA pseudouridine2605 synthase